MVKSPKIFLKPETRDLAVEQLTEFFKEGRLVLQDALVALEGMSPVERGVQMQRISGIINDLEFGTKRWVEKNIPISYKEGADFAVNQMLRKNLKVSVQKGFDSIHRDAVQALATATYDSMFGTLEALRSRTQRTIAQLNGIDVQDKLFKDITKGETRQRIKKVIKEEAKEKGVVAFTDRGGKRWDVERYSEMVARTSRADVFNNAVANRALENGFDLVQVTRNSSSHVECAMWEGKVLSLTGATPGYPTLEDAKLTGIFHPNCKHTYTPLSMEEAVTIPR